MCSQASSPFFLIRKKNNENTNIIRYTYAVPSLYVFWFQDKKKEKG